MWSNQTGWYEVASLHRLLAACGVGRSFLWGRAIVDRARCQVGSDPGGFVKFYESQCKSRDKYYLLFEERHSKVPTVQKGRIQRPDDQSDLRAGMRTTSTQWRFTQDKWDPKGSGDTWVSCLAHPLSDQLNSTGHTQHTHPPHAHISLGCLE